MSTDYEWDLCLQVSIRLHVVLPHEGTAQELSSTLLDASTSGQSQQELPMEDWRANFIGPEPNRADLLHFLDGVKNDSTG